MFATNPQSNPPQTAEAINRAQTGQVDIAAMQALQAKRLAMDIKRAQFKRLWNCLKQLLIEEGRTDRDLVMLEHRAWNRWITDKD